MATGTVEIDLDNDLMTDSYGNQAYISGKFIVSYNGAGIYGSVDGNYEVSDAQGDSLGAETFTEQALVQLGPSVTGSNAYLIDVDQTNSGKILNITYTTEMPKTLVSISYTYSTSYGTNFFDSLSNPPGSTDDAQSIALCFVEGTFIQTIFGGSLVERLAVGDLVITASGKKRPITWLGHRSIDCGNHPKPETVLPIRVAAHAFGESRPSRDLYLSPGHPVLVDADDDGRGGYLVPIMCLVNGTTIKQVAVDKVSYWHVELDRHDILLAEGLPAESYIDLGSRSWFAGADGVLNDPDLALPGMPGRCRPVAISGPVVDAERHRLDGVFTAQLAAACAWPSAENRL